MPEAFLPVPDIKMYRLCLLLILLVNPTDQAPVARLLAGLAVPLIHRTVEKAEIPPLARALVF